MSNAADASASFKISLDSDETTGAAEESAAALEKLRAEIKSDVSELGEMQRAMKNIQAGSVVNIKQFKELSAAIDAKKSKVAQAQSSYLSLGGTFKKLKAPTQEAKRSFEDFGKVAGKMPGPLGEMTAKFTELRALVVGGGVALGLAAIAAAVLAITAAMVAGAVALTNYAIAQGDARRSELLRLEGLTKLRNYYGLVAGNAKEMQDSIDKVAAGSAVSRDKVSEFGTELYRMGLRGKNFSSALEGVALKASVYGDAAGHAFANWAANAALTGQSVQKLTDRVKSQIGGVAQKQMASLAVQAMKAKEGFDALFSAIKVDAFLNAKKTVTDLLSQGLASGQALKTLMGSIVQPMVDMATKAQPYIKRFFQGMIIAALQLDIAWLSLRIKFQEVFGKPAKIKSDGDNLKAALTLGKVAMYGLAAATGAVGLALAALALPFAAFAGVVFGAYKIVTTVWGTLYRLWDSIDWSGLGDSIIQGIETGLGAGASHLVEMVSDLGTEMWSSLKKTLGIHSPSKVFATLGIAIPQGVATGVKRGAPEAQKSVDNMLGVPSMPAAANGGAPVEASAAPGSSKAPTTYNFSFGDIVVSGKKGDDAKAHAEELREQIEEMLETVSLQLGVAA